MKRIVFICLILLSLGGAAQTSSDSSVVMRYRIFYPVNKTELYEDYMSNANTLHLIREYLKKSPQIDSITIYSYASPEGPYLFNKYLAAERGKTAKEYLLKHLPADRHLPDSLLIIDPTAENWQGLRDLVLYQYPLADKEEVLALLDRTDITDERRKVLLKRLDGGRTWRYILKHLMPQLRYATWVSVWKRIPVQRVELPKPAMPELGPLDAPPMVMEREETILALKTNLLYDALSWLNFSVEVPLGDRFSALYYHQFPWWTWGEGNNEYCMRFLSIGAEARWWFKPEPRKFTAGHFRRDKLVGHFVGVYAESGKWDFERKRDICYQGEHWSVGLSYGYAMPVGKRLNLELSISAGYASIAHRGYEPSEDYEILWRDPDKVGRWHYIGPTKAQVSLVLPFIVKYKKGGKR